MAEFITSVPAGELAESLFIQPLLDNPSVSDLGLNIQVMKKGNKLYFLPQVEGITYLKEDCGWDYSAGPTIGQKTVTPVELAAAIEQCYVPFMNTYFADMLPAGARRGELGAEIQGILIDLFNEGYKNDIIKLFFLGDTALTGFYGVFDGVYKKLSADANIPDAGAITDNDLLPANIEATLYRVYNAQSRRLRATSAANKVMWVTGSVFDAWQRYLQLNTGNNIVIQRDGVTMGIAEADVKYNGIRLVPLRFVDDALAADFTSGSPATVDNPHRIILTDPRNHILGLDKTSFGDTEAWYSRDDDKYRIAGSTLLAYEYGWSDLQVIAGF